jgi:hypothetical protein
VDEEGVEFLRVLAAMVAVGRSFPLLTLAAGTAALAADDLPETAERYLEAMAELGVRPTEADEATLRRAIEGCGALLRLADPARVGLPPVLALDPRALPEEPLVPLLLSAGQLVVATHGTPTSGALKRRCPRRVAAPGPSPNRGDL